MVSRSGGCLSGFLRRTRLVVTHRSAVLLAVAALLAAPACAPSASLPSPAVQAPTATSWPSPAVTAAAPAPTASSTPGANLEATATPPATVSPTSSATSAPAAAPTPAPPLAAPPPSPAPPSPVPAVGSAERRTVQSWQEKPADFQKGQAGNVQPAPDGLRLAALGGGFVPSGEYESQVREADFPFLNAVLSWNAETPPGTSARFELRVQDAKGWSGWYAMGEWKPEGGNSVAGQSDARGRVEVDTLKLNAPAMALQYRVRLTASSPGVSPLVRQMSVVYADLRAGLAGPTIPRPQGAARDLDVPRHSQLLEEPSIALKICSPTSLAMVLQYWGVKKTVAEVATGVRDRTTGIYGDWPLNTAFAAANGFEARVDRFYSVEQLERETAAGRPVMISIAFARGELPELPSRAAPDGHLIVVRGFTPEGDVIVNDPDSPTDQAVRHVYKREWVQRIWQRSGGIVYLISPRSS